MAQRTISAAALVLIVLAPWFVGGDHSKPAAPMPSDCVTSCGGVVVQYRFRMGSDAGCRPPGFKLTCNDTTGSQPRLLFDVDGTLQISLIDVRVPILYAQREGDVNIDVDRVPVQSHIRIRILTGVAAGTGLILLALISYFISYKCKHRRAEMLQQKYLEGNRTQLRQKLAPQRVDISEKMIITLKELEKATNNFDEACKLGGGGHGTVYKGVLSDHHVVAIKKPKFVAQREIDDFMNEVAILSQINHRNVVKLHGCCLETEVPILVYEFISNGTLYDHLHVEEPMSLLWDDRLRIAIEIAKSLAYLHSTTSMPIIHRDVKPANILLDDTLTTKVADFGASRYIPFDKYWLTTMVQGTLGYLDPTYLYTGRLTEKSDVYSFGVMIIELMTRKKPSTYISSEGSGLVAHFSTLFIEGNLSQILDPQVINEGGNKIRDIAGIAVACVKLRWEERPTMRQVELWLEAAQSPEKCEANGVIPINSLSTREGLTSRQYSMEEEYTLSARYPR